MILICITPLLSRCAGCRPGFRLDGLGALVGPDAGEAAAGHRHVAVQPLAREDAEHARAAHDDVGRLVAPGHGQQVL